MVAVAVAVGETRRKWRKRGTEVFGGIWDHEMIRNYTKKFLWFKSLCLCVSAGNKIQHNNICE